METVTIDELQALVADLETKCNVVDYTPSYNGGAPFVMTADWQTALAQAGIAPSPMQFSGTQDERLAQVQRVMDEHFTARTQLWRELAASYGSKLNHPSVVFMPPEGQVLHWTEYLALRAPICAALGVRAQTGQPMTYAKHGEGFVFYPAANVNLDVDSLSIPVTPIEIVTMPASVGGVLLGQAAYEGLLGELVNGLPQAGAGGLHVHSTESPTDTDPLESEIIASLDALMAGERLETASAVSPVPILDDPNEATRDYLGFEEYLDVMRRLHQYEEMPNEHKLQFDQAITYRWRDIKALKTLLRDIEGNPNGTALTRYNREMQLLSNRLDQSYLEQHMLRNAMRAEIELLDKQIKRFKKEGKLTQAGNASMIRGRFSQYLDVMGAMDPTSVDALTRMHIMLKEADARVAHLNQGFVEEAKYHYDFYKQHAETDPERAKRHYDRARSLLERTRWPLPQQAPADAATAQAAVSAANDVTEVVDLVAVDAVDIAVATVGESLDNTPAPEFLSSDTATVNE